MKELTKAEEQIMQILWKLEKGFVKDILAWFPKPKPAYNTVSTIVRILEKKGFLRHEQDGVKYVYHPIISHKKAMCSAVRQLVETYFDNPVEEAMTALIEYNNSDLSDEDINRLIAIIERKKGEDTE